MNHILTPLLAPSIPCLMALQLRLSPYIHSSNTSDPSLEPTLLVVVTSFTLDTSVYSFTTILPTYIPRQTPRRPGYPPGTLSSLLSHPYTTNRLSRVSHIISAYGTHTRIDLHTYYVVQTRRATGTHSVTVPVSRRGHQRCVPVPGTRRGRMGPGEALGGHDVTLPEIATNPQTTSQLPSSCLDYAIVDCLAR